jgi:hypothetical protein
MADTPSRFTPSFIQTIIDGARSIRSNLEQTSDSNFESTSSFFYDVPGVGLKSTQQVNLDWSKFENHTFFNSAEVNVNIAFDRIINGFPFDGTRREYEKFFEGLSGFEKWVFDRFPKNVGYLFFSGTATGENGANGTSISVRDYAGGVYPELSKVKSGTPVIDPGDLSWTVELQIYVPPQANGNQVVFQRISGTNVGYTYFLNSTGSSTVTNSTFVVQSGSFFMSASVPLTKGRFNHVALTYDKDSRFHRLRTFLESEGSMDSTTSVVMGPLTTAGTNLTIGSGSTFNVGIASISPDQTFSGALDEFRFFHSTRSESKQAAYAQKSIYASDDLKLYFKFNEPSGALSDDESDAINRIVLDSSGNSLHSHIDNGFSFSLRSTGSIPSPMTLERFDLSPVLFTSFGEVAELNIDLLRSATQYDAENPNLITRLVPKHYLVDGQAFDGFETQQGLIGEEYQSNSIPGSGKLGNVQLMLTFLYIWAKFFDELKIFVDAFSKLHFVDYSSDDTSPDQFIPQMYKSLGFNMPPLFLDASIEQYVNQENVEFNISRGAHPLKSVQNQILRRILVSMGSIIRSKGTQRSIKSFMRAVGIDPDNSFRIREFGGPTARSLTYSREEKIEPGTWLSGTTGASLATAYLSSSRLEPGFPQIAGQFVQNHPTASYHPHGISNNRNDGLLTSGSWTFEANYKYPLSLKLTANTQSLARMEVTGTLSSSGGTTFNLVAISGSGIFEPHSVVLYGRPSAGANAPVLKLEVDVDIFDGDRWYISFGRMRGDESGYYASSSYFLRASKDSLGTWYSEDTAWFREVGNESTNASSSLENLDAAFNASGSFIRIGTGSMPTGAGSSYLYLNNTSAVTESAAHRTVFEGQVAQIRFWSKALSNAEWKEHTKNYKSLGVEDPLTNFNFSNANSGSFGKLRADISMRQPTKTTDPDGRITFFDFSQHNLHAVGSNWGASTNPFIVDIFRFSTLSPYFDEASTNEKIRVRSYQDYDKVQETPWAEVAPVYRINPSERPTDNTRFSIEFSLVDALNRDMINIFATLDSLDNIIGNPELVFSPDYPGLEYLRDIYFNRLTDKLNFKSFFEFFRWFEQSIGMFIDQLIPRKTKYFGTNFVIESHMLERPKFELLGNDIYLGENDRYKFRDVLLLQQISGIIRKY